MAAISVSEALQEFGWTKGTSKDRDGRLCIIGAKYANLGFYEELRNNPFAIPTEAMLAVSNFDASISPVAERLFPDRVVYNGQGDCMFGIARFNDHKDTTFEDVMLVTKHWEAENAGYESGS